MENITNASILIVDDSLTVRRQVQNALSPLNLNIAEASDGLSALEFLENNHVALLLTDINMPRMNGVDLLVSLKERGITVPSIVLTSESQVERLKAARDAGALGWIHKPFDPKHLATSVSRALARLSFRTGASP